MIHDAVNDCKSLTTSEHEAGLKIFHALKCYKKMKGHLIKTFKNKLERCQRLLCKLFRGYLYRRAFLAHSLIFMDAYMPLSQVGNNSADVYIVGDFTHEPWKVPIKCEFSDFFKSYKVIIPAYDGAEFKFIVNGHYQLSQAHPSERSLTGAINNIVRIYHKAQTLALDQKQKKYNLMNSLSLSNPAIKSVLLDPDMDCFEQEIGFDMSCKQPKLEHDDSYFKHNISHNHIASPSAPIQTLESILTDQALDDRSSDDELSIAKQQLTRPRSECFLQNFVDLDNDNKSSGEDSIPEVNSQQTTITSGAYYIGKEGETYEDAYFLHKNGIGIADGVSSWNTFKISTDLFSKNLMKNAKKCLEQTSKNLGAGVNPQLGYEFIDPVKIMDSAFELVIDAGSATCCVAVMNDDKLDIANLGDSGYMVFEYKYEKGKYKVFLKERSKPQQHSFNYPYQLVCLPDEEFYMDLEAEGYEKLSQHLQHLVESDSILCSQAKDSDTYSVKLNYKKIIVFGTDGLFDNLFVYEITNIIQEFLKNSGGIKGSFQRTQANAEGLAKLLCKRAYFKTKDPLSKTPFQKDYFRAKGKKYLGGKVDDITAVVVF